MPDTTQKAQSLMEPRRILVPVKGDEADEQVVKLACRLAKQSKGRVFVLHVVEVERSLPLEAPTVTGVERGDAVLDRMEDIAKKEKCPVEAELLQAREAGPAVVEEALQRNADLILMGLEFKKHQGQFNLGTCVPYVMMRAPCRVWVSREPLENSSAP